MTGSGALVLKLRPGTVRYKLRCAGDARAAKPRATGTLTVKRDSGDVRVSRRPAVNVLDADGRRYTVLFQSRLPALTMNWAAAPAGAGAMSLHVESPAGKQTFPSPTASRQLASGALAEGSYVCGTRRPTGGRRRRRPSPSASTTRRPRRSSFPSDRARSRPLPAGRRRRRDDRRGEGQRRRPQPDGRRARAFPGHGRTAERRRRGDRPTRTSAHRCSLLRAPSGIAATRAAGPCALTASAVCVG